MNEIHTKAHNPNGWQKEERDESKHRGPFLSSSRQLVGWPLSQPPAGPLHLWAVAAWETGPAVSSECSKIAEFREKPGPDRVPRVEGRNSGPPHRFAKPRPLCMEPTSFPPATPWSPVELHPPARVGMEGSISLILYTVPHSFMVTIAIPIITSAL